MQKMLQLPLSKKFDKPVFLFQDYPRVYCLLDTGANIAVWCDEADYLRRIFPDAKLVNEKIWLSGFGGDGEIADAYRIPELVLQSSGNSIKFRNLTMAVSCRLRNGYSLILPGTVFLKTDYRINNYSTEPNLQIYYERDEYGFTMKTRLIGKEWMKKLNRLYGIPMNIDMRIDEKMICYIQDETNNQKEGHQ